MNADCNNIKAKVLTAALPYIQKYAGKTVVVKYGGNAMIHAELKKAVMSDIILLSLVGIHVVLVHGGGPEITGMLKKLDIPSRFVDGLRYTDEETALVVQMVLAGKTNKDLVSLIGQLGGKAIGLCGIDGGMIKAKKIGGDYGFVGEITEINIEPIIQSIEGGYIPVIATVGTDCKGQTYNINADTA
ncbi:MAG: acetylglutamate kinase, partial [Anaerotignum sp.]|nr:acetylglutamate kinase [Anaerotignum sp.]